MSDNRFDWKVRFVHMSQQYTSTLMICSVEIRLSAFCTIALAGDVSHYQAPFILSSQEGSPGLSGSKSSVVHY
jgi:hypothetical protein